MINNLDTAVKYFNRGWSIISIIKKTKIPTIPTWLKFQTQCPTLNEIYRWWGDNPDANLALICGEISGIIVVDIDSGHGVPDLKGLELPPTLTARSGSGGKHLFYKWRKGLIGKTTGFRDFVDIISTGSYVILPPSIHEKGGSYEWLTDENEEIAEAPKWLEKTEKETIIIKEKLFYKINELGTRNTASTSFAGKIINQFQNSPDLDTLGLMVFKQWNEKYNNPPLPENELITIWNSIKKTHYKNIEEKIIENKEDKIIEAYLKNKTKGTYLLAKYIVDKYSIITIGEKIREMFVYLNGIYKPAENIIIYPEIQKILQDLVNKNAKTETFHKIADMTSFSRKIFNTANLKYIPLKNGVYNFETKELLLHSPEYKFTYQFPIIYHPNATCPKMEVFLNQILSPQQKEIVQEWLGYYFLRNYMFKKALIFVGEGDTGKTTLLEVISYLLGKENLSSIPLQKMSTDKFSSAQLYEKHGNLVDELSAKDIHDTGAFKIATGGGSITGEYKFGNQFSFLNFSKLTFACNKIPDVTDTDDEAYFNRWLIIRFENKIEKKIPNFISTLTTDEERSGLFIFAMEGLQRLLKQKEFSCAKNAVETKTEMMRSGSSIAMFTSERLEEKEFNEITKENMYESYTDYCRENKLATQTKDLLGKRLMSYASYITDGLITITKDIGKTERVKGWRNVRIKGTNLELESETESEFGDYDKIKPDDINI